MSEIEIIDARLHNLKNLHLKIPKGKITTITGVSGSGKSSLAYDTLFMEGQRNYLQSLSLYARQFIKTGQDTLVKAVKGLSPTISVEQKPEAAHYNATVGTLSGIHYYLRILYSNLGVATCPGCKGALGKISQTELMDHIFNSFSQKVIYIFASIHKTKKGSFSQLLKRYQKKGYQKVLIDNKVYYLDGLPLLKKFHNYSIYLQIDAVRIKQENDGQITESLELANFEGDGEILIRVEDRDYFFSRKLFCQKCKISLVEPQPATFSPNSSLNSCTRCHGTGLIGEESCQACQGSGLDREALSFIFKGYNIFELGELNMEKLFILFKQMIPDKKKQDTLYHVVPQILRRLENFNRLNLGYLNLNRKIKSLAGGEVQRTRLVAQTGLDLSGIIYILDEPSIGLHPSEIEDLVKILRDFRARDNTIVIVEHDEDFIRSSDYVIELGPGAGEKGGRIVFSGPIDRLEESENSLVSDYLYRRKQLQMPKDYSTSYSRRIRIEGLHKNNLRDLNIDIPLNIFAVVTGVSGSGKSSLIIEALYPLVKAKLEPDKFSSLPPRVKSVSGIQHFRKIMKVDQKVIGGHGRSTIVTYINLLPAIAELFSALPLAKVKGFTPQRFNYNHPLGLCKACRGMGEKKINQKFLPDLIRRCEVCEGTRYHSEVLSVEYKGLSIARTLQMTVSEAFSFFSNIPQLARKLSVLREMGLGYLRLGQKTLSLSGGESQRLKLSRELVKAAPRDTLYLFDEPTVGLHHQDIQNLLSIFNAIISRGNSIVVIEHNLDIIRLADYVIELGPAGGDKGGNLVFCGTVKEMVEHEQSITGQYLKKRLKKCQ